MVIYLENKIKNLGIVRGRDKVVNLPVENIDPFFDLLKYVTCFSEQRYPVFEDQLGT
tara:strand:- start:48 stop:218 length:171 start_codon:yes stop_codon:yes gene_type:complete